MAENPLRRIRIGKITLNMGTGKNEEMLKRGLVLLQKISPVKPVKTVTRKRIPGWGLRPGLAIGCKATIRRDAEKLLRRLLAAKNNKLDAAQFDNNGNFSFGIPEYIDIAGLDYDPELKILGLEVAVSLERPGARLLRRKLRPHRLGRKHRLGKEEAISFVRQLGIEVSAAGEPEGEVKP